jgi:site-specific DNA-methyltransferase (adenine-specific)
MSKNKRMPLVEMLIKSCTNEKDDCFILFGGSGSELVLCKNLKRNYISCEMHPEYYQMILDRLNNEDGHIKDEYRLQFIQEKYKNCTLKSTETNNLFRDI